MWAIVQPEFTVWDLAQGTLCSVLTVGGCIMMTTSFRYGLGGPIMSIDSCKSLVILLFNVIVSGILPTWLQTLGLAVGIAGASVVSICK